MIVKCDCLDVKNVESRIIYMIKKTKICDDKINLQNGIKETKCIMMRYIYK